MLFRQLYDSESSTYTYVLADESTREAVIIDGVLEQADRDLGLIKELGLKLVCAMDTHVHADHVTSLGTLRERVGCTTVLSERAGTGCPDRLVKDGDTIRFGAHTLEVRETPGHTDGCVTYVLGDHTMAFTGDAILIRGTGRTDFQGGSARSLFASIHEKIFVLPDSCLLYPGHDYKGRTVTSVAEERRFNPRIGDAKSEADFVAIMDALVLAHPKKIDVALPANLVCGVPRNSAVSAEPAPSRDWAPIEMSAGAIPEVVPAWAAMHMGEFRFVDVREPDEWTGALAAVSSAELVPLASVSTALEGWDADEPIVLVCRSGGRSGKAAMTLIASGFTKVASVRGGMTRWHAERIPISSAV